VQTRVREYGTVMSQREAEVAELRVKDGHDEEVCAGPPYGSLSRTSHEGLWEEAAGAEIRLCVLLTDRQVHMSPSGTLVWRSPLRPGTPVEMLVCRIITVWTAPPCQPEAMMQCYG
jgi:hypothetical protein